MLAFACHRLGDTEYAATVRELLEPYADRNIVSGRVGAFCVGPAAYYLGLLDLTLDQPELAVRRFEHAAMLAARIQAPPMIAMSHEGQARALLALDRPGDRQQAAILLGEAAATAKELGIHGLGSGPTPCSRSWRHRRRRPGRPG